MWFGVDPHKPSPQSSCRDPSTGIETGSHAFGIGIVWLRGCRYPWKTIFSRKVLLHQIAARPCRKVDLGSFVAQRTPHEGCKEWVSDGVAISLFLPHPVKLFQGFADHCVVFGRVPHTNTRSGSNDLAQHRRFVASAFEFQLTLKVARTEVVCAPFAVNHSLPKKVILQNLGHDMINHDQADLQITPVSAIDGAFGNRLHHFIKRIGVIYDDQRVFFDIPRFPRLRITRLIVLIRG
mmetsp:Transcript_29082/g.55930  ORF Transcript_29082/g.55930 Transcript_29082/m.55930 type:complete len:236 (-) Transcript_29082:1759-2466(-)